MLELKNINTYYDKSQALWDLSLRVEEKEIVAPPLAPFLSKKTPGGGM